MYSPWMSNEDYQINFNPCAQSYSIIPAPGQSIITLLIGYSPMKSEASPRHHIKWYFHPGLADQIFMTALTQRFVDCQSGIVAWKWPTARTSITSKHCPVPSLCIRTVDYNSQCWTVSLFYWCRTFMNIYAIPFILGEQCFSWSIGEDFLPVYVWCGMTNFARKGCIASNKYMLRLRML